MSFPDDELELVKLVVRPPYLAVKHPPNVALVVGWIPHRVPKWDFFENVKSIMLVK